MLEAARPLSGAPACRCGSRRQVESGCPHGNHDHWSEGDTQSGKINKASACKKKSIRNLHIKIKIS